MKLLLKTVFVLELILIPFLLFMAPAAHASGGESLGEDSVAPDGKYYIIIVEEQWVISAIDYGKIANENGVAPSTNMDDLIPIMNDDSHKVHHRIGSFVKGANITFIITSKDVQHGFSINEVDLNVATNRPTPGNKYGDPKIVDVQFPKKDITMSAFCHIFCGLGHPDMKMKFIVGEGSFEAGPIVYYIVIAINIAIFAFVSYSIYNKVKSE